MDTLTQFYYFQRASVNEFYKLIGSKFMLMSTVSTNYIIRLTDWLPFFFFFFKKIHSIATRIILSFPPLFPLKIYKPIFYLSLIGRFNLIINNFCCFYWFRWLFFNLKFLIRSIILPGTMKMNFGLIFFLCALILFNLSSCFVPCNFYTLLPIIENCIIFFKFIDLIRN